MRCPQGLAAHQVIQQKAVEARVRELSVNWSVSRLVATAAAASQNTQLMASIAAEIFPRICGEGTWR